MKQVEQPDSFTRFRAIARSLLQQEAAPDTVLWTSPQESMLCFEPLPATPSQATTHHVSKAFLALAETVACHRNPIKWMHLYRILWKLTHGEKHLLHVGLDDDVVQCKRMAQAIHRDCHKMKAFVRFREIEDPTEPSGTRFIAWFEPDHLIVKRMASFFKKRFTNMTWSILTPDDCMHWDQRELQFTAGMPQAVNITEDNYETYWLTYYKNIFNPARLKEKAMCTEMPKKYWKNLPEAKLIPNLIRQGKAMKVKRPTPNIDQ